MFNKLDYKLQQALRKTYIWLLQPGFKGTQA
jgi:hypothetical protein